MKVKDLIEELLKYDQEQQIGISVGDDILGDYEYKTELDIHLDIGYKDSKGTIWQIISNYRRDTDKSIDILVLS